MDDLDWIDDISPSINGIEVGDRIKLINMNDDPKPIEPGTLGTVTSVSVSIGVITVNWDNGRTLGLLPEIDQFKIVTESSDSQSINNSMPKPTLKGKNISKPRTNMNKTFKSELNKGGVKDIKVEDIGDKVKGGKSDNLTPQDIADKHNLDLSVIQKEIKVGLKVEKEHTNDMSLAREITLDHLTEFPDYYSNKKYGIKHSEKGLKKVHESRILENFFGGLGNAFGGKKKDQYDNKKLVDDLTRITNSLKTSGPQHKESITKMIENFRERYSQHPMIDTMMKSLYHELDNIGDEIEETTGAASSGGGDLTQPLFGVQKRNESRIIKVRDLLEGTTTQNTDKTDGSSPFDGDTWVDIDGDGWMFDDKPAWEGGEIIDILAKTKNINWKDSNLNTTSEKPKKTKITKEELIKTINFLEENHQIVNDLELDKIKDNYLPPTKEEEIEETTTFGSVMGQDGGKNVPVGPMFAAKDDKDWRLGKKPIWKGGTIVQKVKNSGVLSEVNKVKWHKDGTYVKLKDTCVKYKNQPWCSSGDADKPLLLSKTTSDNISEVSKKLGISEKEVKNLVIKRLSR